MVLSVPIIGLSNPSDKLFLALVDFWIVTPELLRVLEPRRV